MHNLNVFYLFLQFRFVISMHHDYQPFNFLIIISHGTLTHITQDHLIPWHQSIIMIKHNQNSQR